MGTEEDALKYMALYADNPIKRIVELDKPYLRQPLADHDRERLTELRALRAQYMANRPKVRCTPCRAVIAVGEFQNPTQHSQYLIPSEIKYIQVTGRAWQPEGTDYWAYNPKTYRTPAQRPSSFDSSRIRKQLLPTWEQDPRENNRHHGLHTGSTSFPTANVWGYSPLKLPVKLRCHRCQYVNLVRRVHHYSFQHDNDLAILEMRAHHDQLRVLHGDRYEEVIALHHQFLDMLSRE